MNVYTIKITETLTKSIHIQADSEEEALQTVVHNYNCAEDGYVLSSNNFDGVNFEVEK